MDVDHGNIKRVLVTTWYYLSRPLTGTTYQDGLPTRDCTLELHTGTTHHDCTLVVLPTGTPRRYYPPVVPIKTTYRTNHYDYPSGLPTVTTHQDYPLRLPIGTTQSTHRYRNFDSIIGKCAHKMHCGYEKNPPKDFILCKYFLAPGSR